MKIRPISPEETKRARDLIWAGMTERWGWLDKTANPDIDDIWTTYVLGGHHFFVGEIGAEVVATGALWFEADRVGRIVRMSVGKEWRGRGFGRKMTNHLIQTAWEANCHTLHVETNETWKSAFALYLTAGFVETHRANGEVHMILHG